MSLACCHYTIPLLRGVDSNYRPSGYEPDELPLLYLAMLWGRKEFNLQTSGLTPTLLHQAAPPDLCPFQIWYWANPLYGAVLITLKRQFRNHLWFSFFGENWFSLLNWFLQISYPKVTVSSFFCFGSYEPLGEDNQTPVLLRIVFWLP